ncbi:uncharacterized protein SPAPADRAFT_48510 [Spathaspora passalidarum NRRL Y-27907]|uniref:F-box domain-containing protein n=1 Tax=Spathaspora passalidarum (strain NRRL Y-27907 / 11-Y1) TaxID=619300 RepID=G3AH93_SPAPN|nr:uncharacterized protein SPAPADRAFT_48510 [Spathaspora passalidarum NRRL Y-27907]EGW35523.1 hypothetical protein SPAPADRAFT_48510 [Spathaspora passalidarum NRRL Y-27907]
MSRLLHILRGRSSGNSLSEKPNPQDQLTSMVGALNERPSQLSTIKDQLSAPAGSFNLESEKADSESKSDVATLIDLENKEVQTTEKKKVISDPTTLLSLPEELLLAIFVHLNQIDACQIRLVNKKLYKLGTIKLFNSIFVYNPEELAIASYNQVSKARYNYLAFSTRYTIINGFNDFVRVRGTKELSLVRNVVICIRSPNDHSNDCYNYLVEKCPWIKVDVASWSSDLFDKQFTRLDNITQLRVCKTFRFKTDITDNYSIKQLFISGSKRGVSDPVALIPHLKALTWLYINDAKEQDILQVFRSKKISKLKLSMLGLHVPQVPLKKLGDVFTLNEIFSLELHFYNNVTPYDDLKWLASQMTKLRDIHINWKDLSFERIIASFAGHTLHQIRLYSRGNEQEITEEQIARLLTGRERTVTYLSLDSGLSSLSGMCSYYRLYKSHTKAKHSVQNLRKKLPRKQYPNLMDLGIYHHVYAL